MFDHFVFSFVCLFYSLVSHNNKHFVSPHSSSSFLDASDGRKGLELRVTLLSIDILYLELALWLNRDEGYNKNNHLGL